MSTWATKRLDALISGEAVPPAVVAKLELGTLDEWATGWVRKRWTALPDVLNGDGTMFGGYLAALADQMLAFAAMSAVPDDYMFRTANLNVTFHRLGRGDMDIEAKVISQSRLVIFTRVEFRDMEGTLLAEATAQQFLKPLG
jgi:uncharacterized protein (TIGR00369 family)